MQGVKVERLVKYSFISEWDGEMAGKGEVEADRRRQGQSHVRTKRGGDERAVGQWVLL